VQDLGDTAVIEWTPQYVAFAYTVPDAARELQFLSVEALS
jgi:hypothetical protein